MNIFSGLHTATAKHKLRTVATISSISMGIGILYTFIFPAPISQTNAPLWHSYLNGLLIGLFLGLAVSFTELYLVRPKLRQLPFAVFLAIQNLYYLAVINVLVVVVISVHMTLLHDVSVVESVQSRGLIDFYQGPNFFASNAYALGGVFLLTFVRQVNRMLGKRGLINLLIGKYHKPVEEQRIFMFLDLKGSTTIAEKLGHERYHEFLNDFFYDITPAIIESKGDIYQYVGDEVVVTWTEEDGLPDADCINCYFRVAATIHRLSEKYEQNYGYVPTFKAGYHYGGVIAGMVGDMKRAVVFHGDTVNTASRIRSECTTMNQPLLLSGNLLEHLSISTYLTPVSVGNIKLKGKEQEIELFTIKEAA
ncbi:MAG: adenylate/guanylate cyclase domain-containing protein [Bacteroidota bacterium]